MLQKERQVGLTIIAVVAMGRMFDANAECTLARRQGHQAEINMPSAPALHSRGNREPSEIVDDAVNEGARRYREWLTVRADSIVGYGI